MFIYRSYGSRVGGQADHEVKTASAASKPKALSSILPSGMFQDINDLSLELGEYSLVDGDSLEDATYVYTREASPEITKLPKIIRTRPKASVSAARRMKRLSRQGRALQDRNRALQATVKELNQARDADRKRRDDLEERCKQLEKNAEILRTIILKEGLTEKTDDRTLVRTFTSLRQQTQSLAANSILNIEQPRRLPPNQDNSILHSFMMKWRSLLQRPLDHHELVNRLRCEIFAVLYEEVLSRPIFGVRVPRRPQEGDMDHLGEVVLQRLEDHMVRTNVDPMIITEWRIATLRTIEAMRLREVVRVNVAEMIMQRISPFVQSLAAPRVKGIIRPAVDKLSKDAVSLVLQMRKSRDHYVVECVPPQTIFDDYRKLADDMDTEGREIEDGIEEVAYTLFGALTKYTEAAPTKRVILEKSQVVIRTRPA